MANTLNKKGFGTAPVFFTAISTILGAILFLRFGYAVGTLGFIGVLFVIIVGHLVAIPTALAISEISTNIRVEGGGEYFIISRSFGLNIGATIGIALFFSQAISVAFYVIAFTEAFEPFFNWFNQEYGIMLPRQVISLPAMAGLSILILKKGANMGVKTLYVVVAILFISLILFFLGKTDYSQTGNFSIFEGSFRNSKDFFLVFAIIFPAFTGMTAGVGLSGDLRSPRKSIPLGTTAATFIGMIIYMFIAWKLAASASPEDMVSNQFIMSKIAIGGAFIIPIGLAASTISSAIGSIMVAPRTLQALAMDDSFPLKNINKRLAKGKGDTNEPYNATLITVIIAFIFVAMGDVNAVAEIISMFFMVTYGSLCLISAINHFSADPSYRPTFRSKYYISLLGFLMSFWLMFKINTPYALAAIALMVLIYIYISHYHKDRGGLQAIFQGAIFQLNRRLHVYLQKTHKSDKNLKWRPSAVCVSRDSMERPHAFNLLSWISYRYGFGTYIHLLDGYYSSKTNSLSKETQEKLIKKYLSASNNVYIDTVISPSYTSAIAQIIQLPSISGMENNMIIFEFDKQNPANLKEIGENISLAKAGGFDICVMGSSQKQKEIVGIDKKEIHVWIRNSDFENANLMILFSYILLGHPDWKKSSIKIFDICKEEDVKITKNKLRKLILAGRLPISLKNIEIIKQDINISRKHLINERSAEADLTIIGFREEQTKHSAEDTFNGYDKVGNILFINAYKDKEID